MTFEKWAEFPLGKSPNVGTHGNHHSEQCNAGISGAMLELVNVGISNVGS